MDTTFDKLEIEGIVSRALSEDIGNGDITTDWTINSEASTHAYFEAQEQGIISGLYATYLVYNKVDSELNFKTFLTDGDKVEPGQVIAEVKGSACSILTGERTSLNFLRHLSGIASQTGRYVNILKNMNTMIFDTRKTTPGLRVLEKRAVLHGGGNNHRFGLFDMVLIKDNHIAAAGSIGAAVDICRLNMDKSNQHVAIEVETRDLNQVTQAVCSKVDQIMLDNMSIQQMTEAVEYIRAKSPEGHHILVEASGSITLNQLKDIAKTGVDIISVGALTHSAPALDISLNIDPSSLASL